MSDIAAQYGKTYTKDAKLKVLGTPERDTAKIVVRELELPISEDEFFKVYKKKVQEELQHPPLMPGAKELVQSLHKLNIPIAVATSSSEDAMLMKTKNHQDVFKLFHHIVCGSTDPEVKHGKPAPDIFLVCASRFPDKPSPDQVSDIFSIFSGARPCVKGQKVTVIFTGPSQGHVTVIFFRLSAGGFRALGHLFSERTKEI